MGEARLTAPSNENEIQTMAPHTTDLSVDDTTTDTRTNGLAGVGALLASAAALAACGGGGMRGPRGPEGTTDQANLPGSGGDEPAQAGTPPTQVDAARFMSQATFGARSAEEIEALRSEGYEHWLWGQFNSTTMSHMSYLDWRRVSAEEFRVSDDMAYEAIWMQWLKGGDQLRARVAFALSQIFVVSNSSGALRAFGMASYMDMLNREAFGNFRTLLKSVTLHPTMGYYLNMIGSEKENAKRGIRPNENYAREILQLFSIGLVRLDLDGTVMRDGEGRPVPTYDEDVVKGFARAFTGWSSPRGKNFHDIDVNVEENWYLPMRSYPEYHTPESKLLLDSFVIPAGGTCESDLEVAIDNIFNHPNVAPFICRQLIQRLVTSNPSPTYLRAVSLVFNNNGAGVRGDLRAVVRAILLHPEARDPSLGANGRFGKQREPVLRFANFLRALGATSTSGRNDIHELDGSDNSLGQSPLLAPTVFNFFKPDYAQAGPIMDQGLVAPEFQITTETTLVGGLNFFARLINNEGFGNGENRLRIDYTPLQALAADPSALVAHLDLLFFNGQMSASTRQRLATMLAAIPANDPKRRVKSALIVTSLSPDHVIQT